MDMPIRDYLVIDNLIDTAKQLSEFEKRDPSEMSLIDLLALSIGRSTLMTSFAFYVERYNLPELDKDVENQCEWIANTLYNWRNDEDVTPIPEGPCYVIRGDKEDFDIYQSILKANNDIYEAYRTMASYVEGMPEENVVKRITQSNLKELFKNMHEATGRSITFCKLFVKYPECFEFKEG